MKKTKALHPLLFAAFPILSLFAANIGQFSYNVLIMPLAIATAGTLLIWVISALVYRNIQRGAVCSSLVVLPFFSYGHYASLTAGGPVDPEVAFAVLWLIVVGVGGLALFRHRGNVPHATRILNVVAGALVAMSLANIAVREVRSAWGRNVHARKRDVLETPAHRARSRLPNIYYIVMDGYARDDVIAALHGYDNSQFTDYLRDRGFFVATGARSNYCQTYQSLASSLNFTLLDSLSLRLGTTSRKRDALVDMVLENDAKRFLSAYGYRSVAFENGLWSTEKGHSDVYVTSGWGFNQFENALINTTPVAILLRKLPVDDLYELHRKRVLFLLGRLPKTAELRPPIFVFAHIVAPHPPFVFTETGGAIQPDRDFHYGDGSHFISKGGTVEEYLENYKRQLEYTNTKLVEAIDGILENSDEPPIIVIQGDHGSRILVDWEDPDRSDVRECFAILNAYYLPDGGDQNLYDRITPVNTFRVIFNYYFGTDMELLADDSFFSLWSSPYTFINVTHRADAGEDLDFSHERTSTARVQ